MPTAALTRLLLLPSLKFLGGDLLRAPLLDDGRYCLMGETYLLLESFCFCIKLLQILAVLREGTAELMNFLLWSCSVSCLCLSLPMGSSGIAMLLQRFNLSSLFTDCMFRKLRIRPEASYSVLNLSFLSWILPKLFMFEFKSSYWKLNASSARFSIDGMKLLSWVCPRSALRSRLLSICLAEDSSASFLFSSSIFWVMFSSASIISLCLSQNFSRFCSCFILASKNWLYNRWQSCSLLASSLSFSLSSCSLRHCLSSLWHFSFKTAFSSFIFLINSKKPSSSAFQLSKPLCGKASSFSRSPTCCSTQSSILASFCSTSKICSCRFSLQMSSSSISFSHRSSYSRIVLFFIYSILQLEHPWAALSNRLERDSVVLRLFPFCYLLLYSSRVDLRSLISLLRREFYCDFYRRDDSSDIILFLLSIIYCISEELAELFACCFLVLEVVFLLQSSMKAWMSSLCPCAQLESSTWAALSSSRSFLILLTSCLFKYFLKLRLILENRTGWKSSPISFSEITCDRISLFQMEPSTSTATFYESSQKSSKLAPFSSLVRKAGVQSSCYSLEEPCSPCIVLLGGENSLSAIDRLLNFNYTAANSLSRSVYTNQEERVPKSDRYNKGRFQNSHILKRKIQKLLQNRRQEGQSSLRRW